MSFAAASRLALATAVKSLELIEPIVEDVETVLPDRERTCPLPSITSIVRSPLITVGLLELVL